MYLRDLFEMIGFNLWKQIIYLLKFRSDMLHYNLKAFNINETIILLCTAEIVVTKARLYLK